MKASSDPTGEDTNPWNELQEQYIIHKMIGKGAFGQVAKATQKSSGSVVAIKLIEDAFRGNYSCRKLLREVFFLRKLNEMPQNLYTPKLIDIIFNKGASPSKLFSEGEQE